MIMALYYCGEKSCKGHQSFVQDCASLVKPVSDYPGLMPFIQGIGEEETQPYEPVKAEPEDVKARGQITQTMKSYDNKMKSRLPEPQKARVR
jgi:hypothetical protein